MSEPTLETTPIPGLLVVRLPVHADSRGWFKENWQRQKMVALGLPDFAPVQNNVSFNAHRGATRGIHAEPWDKLVSVTAGRVFAAWVDLRAGAGFGRAHHVEIDPSVTVFVPRGVGNAYQALEDATSYSYLVNEHWRAGVPYRAVALDDPTAAVPWPIPLAEAEISAKDRANPLLQDVAPMGGRRTLITGARGQLGRALGNRWPDADLVDREELDLTDGGQVAAWPWGDYDLVLNAAAFTAVDEAETEDGRRAAWAVNATAPARLARLAEEHRFTLVHYSSDYVFDGTRAPHAEDEPLSPLGVYGQTKAAGDLAVATTSRHYVVRTSWVVGDGANFVRTMMRLACEGASPTVVADQVGRLTFTEELARATEHLVTSGAAFGTYNVTNGGEPASWADVARAVFQRCGRRPEDVTDVTTEEWAAGRVVSPRPLRSALTLAKLHATGFTSEGVDAALERYVAGVLDGPQ